MYVHLTKVSSNKKTGPIPVSTISKDSCPKNCPLKNAGCYAEKGPIAIHWAKVSSGERGTNNWDEFCNQIKALPKGQLWRHNQAGDLPWDCFGINTPLIRNLIIANDGRKGFTYTHHDVLAETEEAGSAMRIIKFANKEGFTVNLSANNPEHADQLADLNIGPVVVLMPKDTVEWDRFTPKGRSIVRCPAEYSDITCATCGVCAMPDRKSIIGFTASNGKADNVACCNTRYGA